MNARIDRSGVDVGGARRKALDRAEKAERETKVWFIATAVYEGVLLVATILVADFGDRLHLLIVLAALLVYGTLGMGLITLGSFLRRSTLDILAAVELVDSGDG